MTSSTTMTPRVELRTARAKLAAGRESTIDLLIRVLPPEAGEREVKRPRLNLSLVLDRSGSMGGEKIARAREAAGYCIDQLLARDRLSVVIFDDRIDLLIPSQEARNKAALKEQISSIEARGSTALHEAWVKGGMQVSAHLDPEAINRVLLITDGLANVGLTNTDEIVTQVRGLSDRGVTTSTIGIGEDFNEDLLIGMAKGGGGNAWHVERAEDLPRFFAVELEGLSAQVAHSLTLGLVPADGVRLTDLLNDFELNETGRYRLPDLQVGSPLEIVARLSMPAQPAGTRMRLIDLKLGFTPQGATSAQVIREHLEVEFADESEVAALAVDPAVEEAVQLLMNARARREAVACMDSGDLAGAQGVLLRARALTAQASTIRGRERVEEELQALYELSASLEEGEQVRMSRKKLNYEATSRQRGRDRR